jgi:hypothetical protein
MKMPNLSNLKCTERFTQRYQILQNNDLHYAVLIRGENIFGKCCLKKNFNKDSKDSEFLNSPFLSFLATTALPTATLGG